MEGSIAHFLGTHTYTLHHNITKFIAIAGSYQVSN